MPVTPLRSDASKPGKRHLSVEIQCPTPSKRRMVPGEHMLIAAGSQCGLCSCVPVLPQMKNVLLSI